MRRLTLEQKTIPKIRFTDGCWIWTGRTRGRDYAVYGSVNLITTRGKSRNVSAHRVIYEALVGPIPQGMQLDHLCRNPLCVRPDHLEPVTQRENILRGRGAPARNAAKTHCKHGHEFTPENTYEQGGVHRGRGYRGCRECARVRHRKKVV